MKFLDPAMALPAKLKYGTEAMVENRPRLAGSASAPTAARVLSSRRGYTAKMVLPALDQPHELVPVGNRLKPAKSLQVGRTAAEATAIRQGKGGCSVASVAVRLFFLPLTHRYWACPIIQVPDVY